MSPTPEILERPELPLLTEYKTWSEFPPFQPKFGEAFQNWCFLKKWPNAAVAARALGVGAESVRKYFLGGVPSNENQAKLRAAGFTGEFTPDKWQQDCFVAARLVRIENKRWNPADDERKRFFEKYAVTLSVAKSTAVGRGNARVVTQGREEVEFVFGTRVTDVLEIVSKGDAVSDWTTCQALNHALGVRCLKGFERSPDGGLEPVDLRGKSYRKLESVAKNLVDPKFYLDTEGSAIRPMDLHDQNELLTAHEWAFKHRFYNRDRAGQLGSRAHKLAQAWIKFRGLQDHDQNGIPMMQRVVAPDWFWDSKCEATGRLISRPLATEALEVQFAMANFWTFLVHNLNLDYLETELFLVDVVMGVAGTVDLLVRDKEGKLVLVDYKTSAYIYAGMYLQIGWYTRLLWLNRGEMPDRAYIVRLDKEKCECQIHCVFDTPTKREKLMGMALNTLRLYRWHSQVEYEIQQANRE